MVAVSFVLLLIIMSGRFVRYLAEAAAGRLDAGVLLTLMGLRLPSFLELILPLGLFIGILLAYGRLYVDSEMTVLSASGMSEGRLVAYTLTTATLVAGVVALFSLYIGPIGVTASESLLAEQRTRTEFETLQPARFHRLSSQNGVTYAQSLSDDRQQLERVFMAGAGEMKDRFSIITATTGKTIVNPAIGQRYLVLTDGYQYRGRPGDQDYEAISFTSYSQYVPQPEYEGRPQKATDSLTTRALWEADTLEAKAALHWRLSLPVLVMIIALMAVPLSRTRPRKGRYVKMIPAIVLYIVYLVASSSARGMVEDGRAPTEYLIWVVHGLFLLMALALLGWPTLTKPLRRLGAGRA